MATKPTPQPSTKTAQIFSFLRGPDLTGEQEMPLTSQRAAEQAAPSAPAPAGIDLTGKTKVWLLAGPGRSGKTMFARWLNETATNSALLAAMDPQNRSLSNYFGNVLEPPTRDPAGNAAWLEKLMTHAMGIQENTIVDLGGGNTSLTHLIRMAPDVVSVMESAGVAPIAAYFMSPRQDDLDTMMEMEALGFQPPATAVILNEGTADPTQDRDTQFARLRRHNAYRAVIGRGAVPLRMPRLDTAISEAIEARLLTFAMARDGLIHDGQSYDPFGFFDRARVRIWLEAMEREMSPIRTWRL